MRRSVTVSALMLLVVANSVRTQTPVRPNPTNLGSDANGNPLRRARDRARVELSGEPRAREMAVILPR
jgi:hypothetical protein